MSKDNVFSISIMGKLGLNLHSLNNETTKGNTTIARTVKLVNNEGEVAVVNAISGEMMKHIQSKHLYNIAKNEDLPLCEGCEEFNANRITADKEFNSFVKDKDNSKEDIFREMIEKCVIDDLEGILVTAGNQNIARTSVVEFGWLTAIPEEYQQETKQHSKFAYEEGGGDQENLGQNLYNRPLNSGNYALVNNLEIGRIGQNEKSKEYELSKEKLEKRYKALLKSTMLTFTNLKGALKSSQSPHITDFEGVITYTTNSYSAPTTSPLNDNYRKDITDTVESYQDMDIEVKKKEFNNLGEFAEVMKELYTEYSPWGCK